MVFLVGFCSGQNHPFLHYSDSALHVQLCNFSSSLVPWELLPIDLSIISGVFCIINNDVRLL